MSEATDLIKNREMLTSHGYVEGRKAVLDIIGAAIKAADPYENTRKNVRLEGNKLIVGLPEFSSPVGQEPWVFDLKDIKNIYVAGGGKAAQRMALALEDILGDRITDSQVQSKKGDRLWCKKVKVTFAGHPIPDEDSAAGSQRVLDIYQKARQGDIVFFVTSGGGTALKALPAPGITLQDLQTVYRILYFGCGATMPEANTMRNMLTVVRGKAAKHVHGAHLVELMTLENQPVVGAHTFKSHTYANGYEKAMEVIEKYGIWNDLPENVKTFLNKRDPQYLPPTPEEQKMRPYLRVRIMGPEYLFEGAEKKAKEMGINVATLASSLNDVEAKALGETLGSIAEEEEVNGRPLKPPCALLLGGEVTVAIGKETGIGGRNQELVLSAAPRIAGLKKVVIGSADTDGTDGPGKYTGGIVDGYTMDRIKAAGFNLEEELKHHNSTPVMEKLGDAIYTGNTGTNTRDFRVVYTGV